MAVEQYITVVVANHSLAARRFHMRQKIRCFQSGVASGLPPQKNNATPTWYRTRSADNKTNEPLLITPLAVVMRLEARTWPTL
eukprot:4464627-Pyramimonas_sp.AAC.1